MQLNEIMRWCVIYTKSRGEKKLVEELHRCGIKSYLPLMKQERIWSDRKKIIEVPVFPSYVFVEVNNVNYHTSLQCNNAVKYVFQEMFPATISYKEIENLMKIEKYTNGKWTTSDRLYSKGQLVNLTNGALKGTIGRIIKVKNKEIFTIRVEAMNKTIVLDLPVSEFSLQ